MPKKADASPKTNGKPASAGSGAKATMARAAKPAPDQVKPKRKAAVGSGAKVTAAGAKKSVVTTPVTIRTSRAAAAKGTEEVSVHPLKGRTAKQEVVESRVSKTPKSSISSKKKSSSTSETSTEKKVAKNPLGKLAKAVTDQVSALAKKVSGGKSRKSADAKGEAAKPSAAKKTAAKTTASPAPVASSAPASVSAEATENAEAAAIKQPRASSRSKTPVPAEKPVEAVAKPAASSAPAAAASKAKISAPKSAVPMASASKEEPPTGEPAKSGDKSAVGKSTAKAPAPKTPAAESGTAASGAAKAKSPAKAGNGKEKPPKPGSDEATEQLIRSEEEMEKQAPAPSDVREHIFHERYAQMPPAPPRELPQEYGDTRIVLLVRDPEWIYAYWEVNDATRQELRIPRSGHNRRMVVRLYKITGRNWPEEAAHYFLDVEVSPYANNWYVKLPEVAQNWCAELGMFNDTGEYLPIVRSNMIETPRDTVSDVTDSDWMTVEEVYQKLYGLSTGYAAANAVLHGAAGRGASEMLLRHLQRQVAAGLRGDLDMSSVGLFSGSSESVTADRAPGQKDFWLQVHTELILYGSTDPDAKVTVQGRPVKLNADGTFSLRYALPDGEQVLRVHAVNSDGDLEREVTPVVTRTTK